MKLSAFVWILLLAAPVAADPHDDFFAALTEACGARTWSAWSYGVVRDGEGKGSRLQMRVDIAAAGAPRSGSTIATKLA